MPVTTPLLLPTVAIASSPLVQVIVGVPVVLFISAVNVVDLPIPKVFGAFVIFMLGIFGSIAPQVSIPSWSVIVPSTTKSLVVIEIEAFPFTLFVIACVTSMYAFPIFVLSKGNTASITVCPTVFEAFSAVTSFPT